MLDLSAFGKNDIRGIYGEDITEEIFYMIKKDGDKVETKLIKYDTSNALDGSIGGKIEVVLNGNVLGYRNLYYEKVSVSKDKGFLSKLIDFLKFW